MISSHVLYHKWLNELIYRWPEQNKARLKAFAWLLTGLFLSGHVHLSKIARKLPGKAHNKSKERKLSRLLNNLKLPVRLLYKPIAERLLAEAAQNGQPIRLMIDGEQSWQWPSAFDDRFSLSTSVVSTYLDVAKRC